MTRIALETLWDTITEIHRKFPKIAGWSGDGKSFHISTIPEERDYFCQRYYFYASKFRKNSANTWQSIYNLISKYGNSEGKFLNYLYYNIPHFDKNDRNELIFCDCRAKKAKKISMR